jgi:ZIP family zinc transporter
MNLLNTLSTVPVFVLGLGASIAASLGTGAGALPVLAFGRVSQRTQDVLQSIAAGVMLAATVLSLVLPGIEAGARQHDSRVTGALMVAAAVLVGALAILMVHRHAPHEHFLAGRDGPTATRLRRTWLFVIAITLHNFPEGMAVGVGFGGGDIRNGLALGSAIFVQNLPEGFLVALGLLVAGYRKRFSIFASFATGMVETIGGLVGAAAVATSVLVLPWAMGFAAGAMLFVISHEIIPETHRNGFETEATFGLIGGFVAMVVLNAWLG